MAVVWTTPGIGEDVEVAVHDLEGQQQATITVPAGEAPPAPGPAWVHALDPEGDVVHVSRYGDPGWVAAVRLPSGEVVGRWHARMGTGRPEDGLLTLRTEEGLTILGAAGEVRVRHVQRAAATDPLVVHGVGGVMRLDRSLVVGAG